MVTTVTNNSPQAINTSLFSLDREVQEVKKTTDAINNKLSGIDAGVISINGKQGIVELDASDVDALPSSTVIPTRTGELTNDSGFITINDVRASFVPVTRKVNNKQLNTDITLTASDVGALPNTTVIPTKTSQLTNDSGFITSSDSITGNAATATRAEQDADGNVITDTYATKAELGNKVDKVNGKGLSTNDFTTAEKEKLAGLNNYNDSAVKTLIANETSERKTADGNLQTQITANKSAIDTLNGTGEGSVQKTVTDEIAKVVANAPKDFDTLKEISDWIDTHEDSASAMNTQITTNKNDIASLKTAVAGKSDIGHKHSASDITSGTLPIARGGTGQTTQAGINKAIIGELREGNDVVTDGTMFVSSYASDNGFADTNAVNVPYKRKFLRVWEYIKGKISSVLGLTASNYNGKASTAGTADKAAKADKAINADITKTADTTNGDKLQIGSGTAINITNAKHSSNADKAAKADKATNADITKTLDTTNGDKLQIGSGTAINITNAKHSSNADKANKVTNALTVNGKTYDGSSAVNAGVQTVANGGTGQTTANAAANSFINSLTAGDAVPVDNDYYISQFANGGTTTTTYHRRPISKLWEYIKGKISRVLGLTATNYGGKASKAGTADYAKNMYSKTLDLSSLYKTKFYPVFCESNDKFGEVAIHSPNLSASAEYNQNRIHFDISTCGWTDTPYTLNIREYACYDDNEITIGCIGRGLKDGGWAIWLRGGLKYVCWTRNCELYLKTSDYAYGYERYTVGTNYYGGKNTDVSIIFTPQSTITNGAFSNRNIVAPNITSLEQRTTSLETAVAGKFDIGHKRSAADITSGILPIANGGTADKATKDGKGNNIVDTYATKTSIPKKTSELTNDSNFISVVSAKEQLIDIIHPIGSVYISLNNADPKNIFGGTWVQLKDRFLLGVGDTYKTVNATGGEATHKLTIDEMPSHTHAVPIRVCNEEAAGYGLTQSGPFQDRVMVSSWSYNFDTSSTGDSQSHNNMPPYLTVYMWKRTA